jgi:hypothetical protein
MEYKTPDEIQVEILETLKEIHENTKKSAANTSFYTWLIIIPSIIYLLIWLQLF